MKKFLAILSFFLIVPLLFCVLLYLLACFIAMDVLKTGEIQWCVIRIYIILSIILSIFLSIDKDFN